MDRNILFLCTGNSARSQMAEALLKKHAGNTFGAYSAGTDPAEEIFPPVVEVMKEIGFDISGNKPKGIDVFLGKIYFEKVIIVCDLAEKQCPSIFISSQRIFWPFEDPAKAGIESVREVSRKVRDQIDIKICQWLSDQGIPATPLSKSSS